MKSGRNKISDVLKKIAGMTLVALVMLFIISPVQAKATDYYIKINKKTNVVTVYDKKSDVPVKAFICSAGRATPIGTFNLGGKFRWHLLDSEVYGQYCTRITGHVMFHSVWYYRNRDYASQSYRQYRRLGTLASHGCVRLTVIDAKWIYDNCASGTSVKIFNGTSKDDPLGKPIPPTVLNTSRGWDPTDPNPDNPYLKMAPEIKLKEGSTVHIKPYTTHDLKEWIYARRANGTYITDKTKVYMYKSETKQYVEMTAKSFLFTKIGSYYLKYEAQDPVNKKTKTVKMTLIVDDISVPVIYKAGGNKNVGYGTTADIRTGIEAKTSKGTDLKEYLQIYLKVPGQTDYVIYSGSKLTYSKLGKYYIKYSLKNPYNSELRTVEVVHTSVDNKAANITMKAPSTMEYNTNYNLKAMVSARSIAGVFLTSKGTFKVTSPSGKTRTLACDSSWYRFTEVGSYKVTYSVKNPANGFTATKSATIICRDTKTPVIKGYQDKIRKQGQTVNLIYGITVKDGTGADITAKLGYKVTTPEGKSYRPSSADIVLKEAGVYVITYSVQGTSGRWATVTAEIISQEVVKPQPQPEPEPEPEPQPEPQTEP